jgi:tRNA (cmo5U34)-methyltransferase
MKSRISKGFDFLSPVYDGLARLIIGDDIVISQLHFLKRFRTCHRLLILGGGSGWILDELCKYCPDLEIDYIDMSSRMLAAARKKMGNRKGINFIQGSEDDIPNHHYDGVITNFYLDMFSQSSLNVVIQKIKESLANDAHWVVTDFVNNRRSHTVKLWFMYRFFNIITHIEATQLADWQAAMLKTGFVLSDQRKFNAGFISSNLYRHYHRN